jgi:hypothetical protein
MEFHENLVGFYLDLEKFNFSSTTDSVTLQPVPQKKAATTENQQTAPDNKEILTIINQICSQRLCYLTNL